MNHAPQTTHKEVDRLAFEAVRPETVEELGGWLLRYDSRSNARRKNSVLAVANDGELPLESKVRRVQSFYAERGLPPRFQITPFSSPGQLGSVLERNGYQSEAPTWVMTARLAAGATPMASHLTCTVADRPDEHWIAVAQSVHANYSQRIDSPTRSLRFGYARLESSDTPLSIGVGVLQDSWLGIFSMATLPLHRNKGFGGFVLAKLCMWGIELGATHAYLQVEGSNAVAQHLYFKHGFERAYRYRYLTLRPGDKPSPPPRGAGLDP